MSQIENIALHEATRYRYLSYAMSVITSRALPDVRDGLKPVQRRILYAMYHNLHLAPESRYRKSAAVVGEVMAKYHPHGDSSIYDAMVRMAQPFSLLHPLIDGQGNFGSMDGDRAAAMRYTEAKLRPIAMELLTELKQKTVAYRPNYDGQQFEPVVLPAQFPNLLINGSEGIAVGMSTRIPPHNLRETLDACVQLIDNPELDSLALTKKLKGPDFPTGGVILNSKEDIQNIYCTGNGTVKIRGCWALEKDGRSFNIIISEIPYAVNKSTLVESIGNLIANKKIPQLTDVRDESTDVVRIVLSLKVKPGADPNLTMKNAMAYLCRHTALQSNFPINLTCLVPTDNPDLCHPIKATLHDIIRHWLDFRFLTTKKRFEYELKKLRDRLHLLAAFAKAFDVLDQIIAMIRKSDGRKDAHQKLVSRFGFDDNQAEAILDLRLYKLAKLEILAIQKELQEKTAEAERLEFILSSKENLWSVVRKELLELRKLYGKARQTQIGGEQSVVTVLDESAFIIDENTHVIVTNEGWFKRQARFKSLEKIRIRENDSLLCVTKANTKDTAAFLTDQGGIYVMRVADIPSTTGYGDPIQKYFSFQDGERVIGVIVNNPRSLPTSSLSVPIEDPQHPPPYGVAVTAKGRTIRFSIKAQSETTNKNGRRYMKPDGKDDAIVAIYPARGDEFVSIASKKGRVLCFSVDQITLVRGAGKGVIAIKMDSDDRIVAYELATTRKEGVKVTTSRGREVVVNPNRYAGKRAARGSSLLKRGTLSGWERPLLRYDKQYKNKDASEDTSEEFSDESSETTKPPKPPEAHPSPPVEATPSHQKSTANPISEIADKSPPPQPPTKQSRPPVKAKTVAVEEEEETTEEDPSPKKEYTLTENQNLQLFPNFFS